MAKTKYRVLSVLVMPFMVIALFAGLGLGAPVTAQAVSSGTVTTALQPDNTGAVRTVYFGSYNGNPIQWRIMVNDGSTVTLLSNGSIGGSAGERLYDVDLGGFGMNWNWSESDICAWLNGLDISGRSDGNGTNYTATGFLPNSFTLTERTSIPAYGTTEVRNPDYPGTSPQDDIVISQQIVLPSISEITDGGIFGWNSDAERDIDTNVVLDGWWLRSPGSTIDGAAQVRGSGLVNSAGGYVGNGSFGVRPAFKINLSSVLFTSAAQGGKADTVDAILSPTEPVGGALKLTIKDSTMGFSVPPAITSISGRTITFSYTPTGAGYNTLSAMVVDSANNVKYYGKLDTAPTAAGIPGTGTVTVPDDYTSGDTLKIFVEQVNADYRTDYASEPVPLTFYDVAPTPSGLTGIACATAANNDGKIIGFDYLDRYDYKPATDTNWITLAAGTTELTGLAPGDYHVRFSAVQQSLAGPHITISVAAYTSSDTTAPELSEGTAIRVSDIQAFVNFKSNEAGTYAYIVQEANQPAPALADVQNSANTGTMKSGANTFVPASLTDDKAKIVYMTGRDAAGNWSGLMAIIIPPDHTVLEKPDTLSDGQDAVFTIKGEYVDLNGVSVTHENGTTYTFDLIASGNRTLLSHNSVPAGDVVPSSVKITLYAAWLDTLPAGTYTLKVDFNDGTVQSSGSADFVLTRAADTTPATATGSPQTGDSSNIPLWALCGGLAALGLVLLLRRKAAQR